MMPVRLVNAERSVRPSGCRGFVAILTAAIAQRFLAPEVEEGEREETTPHRYGGLGGLVGCVPRGRRPARADQPCHRPPWVPQSPREASDATR